MTIGNLTPHVIALLGADGMTRIIDQDGPAVRIDVEPGPQVGTEDTVPIHTPSRYYGISNLPPRQEGVVCVVSQLVALAIAALMPDRDDIVYPRTAPGDKPRRERGGLILVSRLVRAI